MSKQHELPLIEPQAQQENTRLQALATLMMTVTIFLQLSGINHLVTAIVDKIKGKDIVWIHFLRMFFATCISIAVGFTLAKWRPFNSNV